MNFYPPLSSREPLPPTLIPTLSFLIVIILALPPSRFISFASLLLMLTIVSQLPYYTSGAGDYVKGCEVGIALLRVILLVFCSNPRRDSWKLHKISAKHQKSDDSKAKLQSISLFRRLEWAFQVVINVREIG
jgi:hypothetical protein